MFLFNNQLLPLISTVTLSPSLNGKAVSFATHACIRAKMSIILSRISLDDYQLKIRSLLRNSKFRKDITTLEKGKFVFPQTDQILEVKPFKQNGKPYQIMKPKVTVKKEREPNGLKEKIPSLLGERFYNYEEEEIEYDVSAYENSFEGEDDEWCEDSGFFDNGEW